MAFFTTPLIIYILYHPLFKDGEKYFNHIYSDLCRTPSEPLSRNIGIPVFKRSAPVPGKNAPEDIDWNEADHNAVVILVDDEMFNDSSWEKYVYELVSTLRQARVYPVAISKYAHRFTTSLRELQYINLYSLEGSSDSETFPLRFQRLLGRLLHELSRQLLNRNASYELDTSAPPPVKLFISHAKKDGETIAIEFRNYVRSETKLSSFFDANDIADSYLFSKEIEAALSKNAVLVVFQTDSYASREWCRREVILAKRFRAPIIIVNAITEFEKRSFPYMGNAPVVRWAKDFEKIAYRALYQTLYQLFSELTLQKAIELYVPGRNDVEHIANSPELFNYVDIIRLQKDKNLKKLFIIYPDPPLGIEEIRLLNDIDSEVEFLTPILLSKKF